MKRILFTWLFAALLSPSIIAQENSIILNTVAGLNVPSLTDVKGRIWKFDADTGKLLSNPVFQNEIQPAFNVSVSWGRLLYKKKRHQVKVCLEAGLGYNYSAYRLKWRGYYATPTSTDTYTYSLDISKENHQLILPISISCTVKRFHFSMGTIFHLQWGAIGFIRYNQNGQVIYDFNKALDAIAKNFDLKFSIQAQIGYTFALSSKTSIIPYCSFYLPAGNFETLSLGNVNRGRVMAMTQIQVGFKIVLPTSCKS